MERALNAIFACIGYGMVYGAAFGATFGTILAIPFVLPPGGSLVGAVLGALFGMVGGAVAGLVGVLIGGRLGWSFAGVVGGAAPAACLWYLSSRPPHLPFDYLSLQVISLGAVLMGSFLGWATGRGLQTGTSAVPGVERLIDILTEGSASED